MTILRRFIVIVLLSSLAEFVQGEEPIVRNLNQRPNILWITAEDMGRQLGCYGDTYADTPQLDQLAREGVRYTRFFAESPMCSPSRATIITGMHNGPLGASQMRSNHRIAETVRPSTQGPPRRSYRPRVFTAQRVGIARCPTLNSWIPLQALAPDENRAA